MNAARFGPSLPEPGVPRSTTPTCRTRSAGCARARSGHTAAVPPHPSTIPRIQANGWPEGLSEMVGPDLENRRGGHQIAGEPLAVVPATDASVEPRFMAPPELHTVLVSVPEVCESLESVSEGVLRHLNSLDSMTAIDSRGAACGLQRTAPGTTGTSFAIQAT